MFYDHCPVFERLSLLNEFIKMILVLNMYWRSLLVYMSMFYINISYKMKFLDIILVSDLNVCAHLHSIGSLNKHIPSNHSHSDTC